MIARRSGSLLSLVGLASLLLLALTPDTRTESGDSKEPLGVDPALAKIPGRELVQRLTDERMRLGAFRELCRRKGRKDLDNLRRPELVVCPQGEGREPLYLVLAEFLPTIRGAEAFDSAGLDELFPEGRPVPRGPLALRNELLIEVITGAGALVEPFGGSSVLNDGIVADINGDGRVERVDHTLYGVEGVDTVAVLQIWPVKLHSAPSLNVLYNWGGDDWAYQIADRDRDGRVEIELGPRQAEGVRAKVVFAWDPQRQAYVSAAGNAGDHFRVLQPGDPWKQLEHLKAEGLRFANDPDAVSPESRAGRFGMPRQEKRLAADSQPYVYRSLRDLDDQAILRYMEGGARAGEAPPPPDVTPTQFWTSPPRSAVAAFLDANRSPKHKGAYRIAIDDRDGAAPPESGTVAYHGESAPCYQSTGWVWFLSARPGDSYLAYGSSSRAGTVFFDFVRTQPSFDLTYAPVTDADARQVLQAVWWLSKVRSKARGEESFGGMASTADGSGRLSVRSVAGASLADAQGTVWAGSCGSRWTGDYGSDEFLNLAAHLVESALPARLGRAWRQPAACVGGICRRRDGPADAHSRDLVKRDAEQILARFNPAGGGVPPALASLAVSALVDLRIRMADSFEHLLRQLPARDPSAGDASAAEARLKASLPLGKDGKPSGPMPSLEEMQAARHEYERVRQGSDDSAGRERLRAALQLAIRQLRTADNVAALEQWAASDDPGWRFALSRLHELDRHAYVRALEAWLKRSEGESRRQVYGALAEADPDRARELAGAAGATSDLAVSSFGVLARAQAIPDETKRIAALVALLGDQHADWQERIRAIDVLAPQDDPQRFSGKSIDEALLQRLEPSPDDRNGTYVVGPAARALARRGRVETFERLLKAWGDSESRDTGALAPGEVVGALVQLLPRGGPRERRWLADAFRARLRSTRGFLSGMILEIWAADLRELLPDLERVATSSLEDVEGEDGSSWRSGPTRPVVDRFHIARKVAALWNEDDPYTRTRLLLAFGRREPILSSPEREAQTKRALAAGASSLSDSPADKQRLRAFLGVVEAGAGQQPDWAEHTDQLGRLTREAFGWSSAQ
jgi:hypothetical protein